LAQAGAACDDEVSGGARRRTTARTARRGMVSP
jgi:hypothetical protein